jgi:hypothetical protein
MTAATPGNGSYTTGHGTGASDPSSKQQGIRFSGPPATIAGSNLMPSIGEAMQCCCDDAERADQHIAC